MVLLYCGRVGRRRVFIKAHPSKRWAFLFSSFSFPIYPLEAIRPRGPDLYDLFFLQFFLYSPLKKPFMPVIPVILAEKQCRTALHITAI